MSRILNSSYQYLQRSKIPTDKFQKSLPRLKIPKLEKTCERFVAALDPISGSDSRFATTKHLANDFSNGTGKKLQKLLIEYDKTVKDTSYINKFWFDMYLSSRVPLPLNFNPFLAYKDAPKSQLNDQLVRATNFLVSAARFKRSLEENVLEPEVFYMNPKKTSKSSFYKNMISLTPQSIATYVSYAFKAFPLDMSQYKNLFNSTRIPEKNIDRIHKFDPEHNRHVLVMKNGQFFTFDLLDKDGQLKSPEDIYACLKHIANQKTTSEQISISELTTADRDFWASERQHLIQLSEKNRLNLEQLDSSMFVLCLDDLEFQPNQQIEGAHNFLHGNNPNGPTNRWFDKSFSILITKDGHSAINFEHSWGDGVAILRFFNDTCNDAPHLTEPPIGNTSESSNVNVNRLDFDLDNRLKESIASCKKIHAQYTGNLELGAVQYEKLNRDYFKKSKLSPDSMSQLAFQIAFKKVYNQTPVTYESCSTAAFRGGRTETVRPCTHETNAATDAIIANSKNEKLSRDELKGLLQACSKKHFQLCKEASMGDGFDRHLFGLKEMALRANKPLHELYLDPLYQHGQQYVLSTSTLYGECFSGGGFAPVVADGFGLGYGFVDQNFGVLVSSYKNHRNNTQFVQALNESLDDIRKIVEV